jgi:alpha-beta hydrolase superfamily lysophospholipase
MDKRNFRIKKYVRWIGWVILVQFALINISAALYAFKFTHVYDDPTLRNSKPTKNILVKTWRLFSGPRQPKSVITEMPDFPIDTVTLKTSKGIPVNAWFSRADSASKGTVILFHGIGANKGMLLDEAYEFRNGGYNVMLVDFRAHGNSGGNITTIGTRETEEIKLAWDYIVQQGEKNIFLFGSSMGAVVVTGSVAKYNLKPAGLILEMPFASLRTHLKARARGMGFSSFGEKPFGFFVTLWIGIERGFNGFKQNTALYAEKVNCPVLMQWGAKDTYVIRSETDKVFTAIAAANKKLVVYEHAGHGSLLQSDPIKWRIETGRFLLANTK